MKQKTKEQESVIGVSIKSSVNYLDMFEQAKSKISPVWDIRDYVAVNPFWGFREKTFLETVKYIFTISGENILPAKSFFQYKWNNSEIVEADIEVARRMYFRRDDKNLDVSTDELINYLNEEDDTRRIKLIRTISDIHDIENDTIQSDLILKEVSKWAAAYFDEGQSLWKISTENQRLYHWWKSLVKFDRPFANKGEEFNHFIKNLPHAPEKCLTLLMNKLLSKVNLSDSDLVDYLFGLLFHVSGWSSYIQKFEFEASRSGNNHELSKIGGLLDLLLIRLAYDIFLIDSVNEVLFSQKVVSKKESFNFECTYILLKACEVAYRRKIQEKLKTQIKTEKVLPDIQMAFCIDVRSEVLRRHLENVSTKIQTLGFAGFFGMPISVRKVGHLGSDQNCPVLLNAKFELMEKDISSKILARLKENYIQDKKFDKLNKSTANSGFSFVETLGLSYLEKMLKVTFKDRKPNIDLENMGSDRLFQRFAKLDSSNISFQDKVELAYSALKNMGLKDSFGKFVFLMGHGSESANNPYASALDCGACAGHNGHVNAKFLTSLLNDKLIRDYLKNKNIDIPEETVFISGWHNTTRDSLNFDDKDNLLKSYPMLKDYFSCFELACNNTRLERSQKLPCPSRDDVKEINKEFIRKANNWSEIRPEWGLARNASFVVGTRALTRGLNLEGRAFLHEYDAQHDHDLSVLELIMTAPMVVTNWINMQYYASTVSPKKFGAGNKVLSNVVGNIGCIEGNDGDLLTGLTLQSVYYQDEYFHEPIRLQVFVEAETSAIDQIIKKHKVVADLVDNQWLSIIAINPNNKEMRLYHHKKWILEKEDLWN